MKDNLMVFLFWLLLLAYIGLMTMYTKATQDLKDYKNEVAIDNQINEKRLEEIEKDIRILKTDSYINTNGFEGGQ